MTQGDPLSMFMYAIGTLPLIRSLHNPSHWTQIWYANDASAGGCLEDIYEWFSLLCFCGPAFGYFPESTKSFVVGGEQFRTKAKALFHDLSVQVVTGQRYLSGFIGDLHDRHNKVHKWVTHVHIFSDIALTQPQLAYMAVTRSLQHEWTFLLRVLPDCGLLFQDLESSLASNFLPTLFGVEITSTECSLFSLPLCMGGLGVKNPVTFASYCYASSLHSTTSLVKFIVGHSPFESDTHIDTVCLAKDHDHASLFDWFKLLLIIFFHSLIVFSKVLCCVLRNLMFQGGCLYYYL